MKSVTGIMLIAVVVYYIIRMLFNRSEHKRFIDNAERFAEENEYTKQQHEFFEGKNKLDYRGRKIENEESNIYGDILSHQRKN